MMEMYADAEARGGVLEPEGTVEIKFRKPEQVKVRPAWLVADRKASDVLLWINDGCIGEVEEWLLCAANAARATVASAPATS
jgi:hypothetical protein